MPNTADSVSAAPTWVLIILIGLITLVIIGMFGLTFYNLSAPRSTLKNILGLKGRGILRQKGESPLTKLADSNKDAVGPVLTAKLLENFGTAARVGKRTTRTTLAITGFSLLGVLLVAVFALSGTGVRDLRSQVVASVTTLAAAIAGFYFGSETGGRAAGSTPDSSVAPTLVAPADGSGTSFTVGAHGTFTPIVSGTPAPVVAVSKGALPSGLALDIKTGAVSGTPAAGSAGSYDVELTATNGVSPNATLSVTFVVEPA